MYVRNSPVYHASSDSYIMNTSNQLANNIIFSYRHTWCGCGSSGVNVIMRKLTGMKESKLIATCSYNMHI